MAVHGMSMAEHERYILKSDPAHPDNIKITFDLRAASATSDEQREEIMAALTQEVGKPTVFLLGNLQHEDRVFLSDMNGGMEQTPTGGFRMTPKNTMKASEAVRRALRGWENFTTVDGERINFSTAPGTGERGQPRSFVSPESMAALHLDIIKELAARILEVNGVTGAIEKKLLSALQGESAQLLQGGLAQPAQTETKTSVDAESQAPAAAGGN